ncbi:MAG: hypothetical protein CHACPFDD_00691 [Phycisphaerae bacterium]|nr:hypothetical protein [Phycisphaerae bacterium]
MVNLESFRTLLRYNDWADAALLAAATPLSDAQLDQPFDMGVGSLRRTLLHIFNGEHVWLKRWQSRAETPWPDEAERVAPATIGERLQRTWRERDAFLATLRDPDLARVVTYRDSKGSYFRAALSDMMAQMFVHSAHHRAQAANMIRRTGGAALDVDYMYWIRQPVQT